MAKLRLLQKQIKGIIASERPRRGQEPRRALRGAACASPPPPHPCPPLAPLFGLHPPIAAAVSTPHQADLGIFKNDNRTLVDDIEQPPVAWISMVNDDWGPAQGPVLAQLLRANGIPSTTVVVSEGCGGSPVLHGRVCCASAAVPPPHVQPSRPCPCPCPCLPVLCRRLPPAASPPPSSPRAAR